MCLTAAFAYLVSACFGITIYNTVPFLFIFLGLGYKSDKHQWGGEDNSILMILHTKST